MEARLGAQLFERTNGGTRPTIAGREFLASARRILAETDVALRRLKTRSRGEDGLLTIGIYASLSTGNMFTTLLDHRHSFPGVEVRTIDGSHDQLLCALTNNAVDIAIMTNNRSGWGDRTLPLWSERVIVALHARHRLAGMEIVQWSELRGSPF
jgi:DNA-binding transcriptional LysR family regulator